jgi:hypothetical protein
MWTDEAERSRRMETHIEEFHNLYTSQNTEAMKTRTMISIRQVRGTGQLRNTSKIFVENPKGKIPFVTWS